MSFGRGELRSHVEVQLGHTRVMAVVVGELVAPFPDRPTEGFLNFNVELSPMASANFEVTQFILPRLFVSLSVCMCVCAANWIFTDFLTTPSPSLPSVFFSLSSLSFFSKSGRPSALGTEIGRVVERGLKDSLAIDTEALCVVAGEKVWSIRCDIHALDHGGNLIDAAGLATVAALLHFRKSEVTVFGEGCGVTKVTVHPSDEREPTPLALHHVPVCVTFGLFQQGSVVMLDPTDREEAVMDGRITYTLNAHG